MNNSVIIDYLAAKMPRIKRDLPHLYSSIVLFWGTKEFLEFMDSIVMSERSDRNGFPPDIMKLLYSLQVVHDTLFPKLAAIHDKWHLRNY